MSDTITLTSPRLRATIAPHGARLETLSLDGGASVVLHADPAQYPTWRDVYPGAIVGPVANRVAGGAVVIDGQRHQMPCNENGVTALHSGPNGLDQRVWEVTHLSEAEVQLSIHLADGDGGLPGQRDITVQYKVEGATLSLTVSAQTDRPTPINIAHHPYWRLGDARAHKLWIKSDAYLPVNAHNIPTGVMTPTAGTPFDHRTAKALDAQTDHNFCTGEKQVTDPVHVATLTGSDGLELKIDSTEPGLQVYAGAYIPTLPGTDIAPFAGIALEPQGWPDAPNHANFPSIICQPGTVYRQITHYHLKRAT